MLEMIRYEVEDLLDDFLIGNLVAEGSQLICGCRDVTKHK
jgi:hypothetical protein